MFATRLSDSIEIFNSTEATADRYGDPTYTEDAGTTVPAWVTPLDTSEIELGRDERISLFNVIVGPDADVNGTSRIEWQGRSLEVVGEPKPFSYRNGVHHLEFQARERLG